MSRLPSASELDRLKHCPGAGALPKGRSAPQVATVQGTVIHGFLENCVRGGKEAALALVTDEWREVCAQINVDALPASKPGAFVPEVGFAWDVAKDVVTAHEGEYPWGSDRDNTPDGIVQCRVDILAVSEDGKEGYLRDYKTGHTWVPSPSDNLQVGLGALMMSKVYGCKSVDVGIIRLKASESFEASCVLDEMALDAIEVEVRRILATTADLKAMLEFTPRSTPNHLKLGPWCKYCPALWACPLQTQNLRNLMEEPEKYLQMDLTGLPPDDMTMLYATVNAADMLVKDLQEKIRLFALSHGPIKVGDGLWYGEKKQTPRESIDGAIAYQAICALLGEGPAREASDVSVTKGGIDAMLSTYNAHSTTFDSKADGMRKILAAIEKRGGIARKLPAEPTVTEMRVKP